MVYSLWNLSRRTRIIATVILIGVFFIAGIANIEVRYPEANTFVTTFLGIPSIPIIDSGHLWRTGNESYILSVKGTFMEINTDLLLGNFSQCYGVTFHLQVSPEIALTFNKPILIPNTGNETLCLDTINT